MISVVTANLISGFLEFTLFGVFVVVSLASLVLLVQRRRIALGVASETSDRSLQRWLLTLWKSRNSPLLLANLLLMLTVTAHFIVSARRLVVAVTKHDESTSATAAFLTDLHEDTQVARVVLLTLAMLWGDMIITYRVWLVWGRKLGIVLFPLLCTGVLVVTASGMIRQFAVSHSSTSVFATELERWIVANCLATFCTNVYGTVAIACRIWKSNRLLRSTGVLKRGRNLLEGLAIFIESAGLYTAWVAIYLAWYLAKSPLETIGSGCGPVVTGITFMLINVRVGLGWDQDSRPGTATIRWAMPVSTAGPPHEHEHDRDSISSSTIGVGGRGRGRAAVPLQTISLDIARHSADGDAEEGSVGHGHASK